MSFINILIIQFFGLIIPGPDFLLVSRTGMTNNIVAVIKVVAGICAGAFIWMILSIMGLRIIFEIYPVLNKLIMIGGACYLMILAYGVIYHSNKEIASSNYRENNHFLKGLMCNLSNPKAIVYFTSIFSVLPMGNGIAHILFIIICLIIESFFCFLGLGILLSHPLIKSQYQKYVTKIDMVLALIFVIFSICMLVECFR